VVKETLEVLGGLFLLGVMLVVAVLIGAVFVFGSVWASSKLLPWLSVFTWISFWAVVFILLPLAIPRATRGFSSVALFFASYVFGATLWMKGLLLTFFIWG
jgi:hypothetical protein